MNTEAVHIDPTSLASEVVRELLAQQARMDRESMQRGRLLYWNDVKELTGWGDKKLQAMIDEGIMPMVKPEGKWFITWPAYLRALDRYYESNLPKRSYRRATVR